MKRPVGGRRPCHPSETFRISLNKHGQRHRIRSIAYPIREWNPTCKARKAGRKWPPTRAFFRNVVEIVFCSTLTCKFIQAYPQRVKSAARTYSLASPPFQSPAEVCNTLSRSLLALSPLWPFTFTQWHLPALLWSHLWLLPRLPLLPSRPASMV